MITYFVLKEDGGKTAGCVRLENGKARSSCPCTLLLEDGTALDLGVDETPLSARPLGAAVLQGDDPVAWGAPPGAKLTKAELLCRLRQGKRPGLKGDAIPREAPEPLSEPAPEPAPEPGPISEPTPEPAPEPGPAQEPEPVLEPAPGSVPEPGPISEPAPEPAPEPVLPSEIPAPADSAALAADFGLLVRHAGEVYESILHPPIPEEKTPSPEEGGGMTPPETRGPKGDWFVETDRLLARLRR